VVKGIFPNAPDWDSLAKHREASLKSPMIEKKDKNLYLVYLNTDTKDFFEIIPGSELVYNELKKLFNCRIEGPSIILCDSKDGLTGFPKHKDPEITIHWCMYGSAKWTFWDKNDKTCEVMVEKGDLIFVPIDTDHEVETLSDKRAGALFGAMYIRE